jgi:hypothetical protein
MGAVVYAVCALTSFVCLALLLRAWSRMRSSLLLWSCLCFGGLALSSVLVFIDFIVVPDVDLSLLRASVCAMSMGVLVFGLVWSSGAP